jgi:bla regulator protein blaR1
MTKPLAVLTLAAVPALLAQEIPTPKYGYEVASIRRAAPGQQNSGFSPGPQGGLWAPNNTVVNLIKFAFKAEEYQIVGLPAWAKSDRFEITLTPDHADIVPDTGLDRAQLDGWLMRNRQRMQAVLRDRFGLAIRMETRESRMYVLTIAKGGHKLATAAGKQVSLNINGRREIVAKTVDMKNFADALSMMIGRIVRDETGLDGSYDFKVEFAPDMSIQLPGAPGPDAAPSADANRPSIFTALNEQLGLRLESKRGPVPMFVVDKIVPPSEN